MTEGYRHINNWQQYKLDSPDGTWTARLDQKAWGKNRNLILYWSDLKTGHKYWLSVFRNPGSNKYTSRSGGPDFNNDAEPGDVFELTTAKTKARKPKPACSAETQSPITLTSESQ